jgi:hypothetical protein
MPDGDDLTPERREELAKRLRKIAEDLRSLHEDDPDYPERTDRLRSELELIRNALLGLPVKH